MPFKRPRKSTQPKASQPNASPTQAVSRVNEKVDAECKEAVSFVKKTRTRTLNICEMLDIIAVEAAVRANRKMFKGDPDNIVALLLRRSNKTVNSIWRRYKETGHVEEPTAAQLASASIKAARRMHRLPQSVEMEGDVRKFIMERSVNRTRTVAKDVLKLLESLGYMQVEEGDAKDYESALCCVQRFLHAHGYKRGSRRGATYRISSDNLARRDEYVLRMAVDPATQNRRRVYLDESYVHHNYARHQDSLYDPTDPLVTKAKHKGRRYCFIAAIISEDTTISPLERVGDKGSHLLAESIDVFDGGKKVKDYHAMFDHEFMVKWMKTLIAVLDAKGMKNCILVMDNAKYHKKLPEGVPRLKDKKNKLLEACKGYGLPVKSDDTKAILWDRIQAYVKKNVEPVLVKMAQDHGHDVVFTPPHYSDLQPIELVWVAMKGDVGRAYTSDTKFGEVKERLEAALQALKPSTVQNCILTADQNLYKLLKHVQEDGDDGAESS